LTLVPPHDFAQNARALRDQYTLAFEPTKTDGEFHKVEVKTSAADHRIRARSG